MEESAIILMLKEAETGFLVKEMGSYAVEERLIHKIYAQEIAGEVKVFLCLTCDKELEDWEYSAVFDYYDTEVFGEEIESIQEEEGFANPCWTLVFSFILQQEAMEEKLNKILRVHEDELQSVYEAIADKKDDYIDEEQ